MWQDSSYGGGGGAYYAAPSAPPAQASNLQFYSPADANANSFYPGSRPSLDGNMAPQGSMSSSATAPGFGGNIQVQGPWWTAFGTGGFEGEPPLLEGAHTALPPLCALNTPAPHRAGHQLLAYTRQIHDSAQPAQRY